MKNATNISSIESDGVIHHNHESIAHVLNQHFVTIGVKLADKIRGTLSVLTNNIEELDTPPSTKFSFTPITEEFVLNELRHLKTNKAIGLDNISARLLKDASSVISNCLTNIFNRSLFSSTFPSLWKCGKVTALFKSGDRCLPGNYRPITVLPSLSKILERAVHRQLYSYLNENKLITSKQFGFRPKLSTEVALLNVSDKILSNMDNGYLTGAVFIDLSKAFDTVDHELLVNKLRSLGMDDICVQWFISYLGNRSQVTSVASTLSSSAAVTVGVPQGSILGPLLFLIYVNDLVKCPLQSEIVLYADDTVLYCSGKNVHELELQLNDDLSVVSHWFNRNLLTINTSKCKFMVFGSTRKLNNIETVDIYINRSTLDRTDKFKYLGIIFNQSLTWHDHVDYLVKKINQRIGLMKRVKHLLPISARITLYNSLIAPLFDYGDIVWGDKNNEVLMSYLQTLQNKAAKIILNKPFYSSASEALNTLGFKILSCRRKVNRLTTVYKCINGEIDFNLLENVHSNSHIHSYNTRTKENFHLPRVRTNWGKQRFVYQSTKEYNSLKQDCKKCSTLVSFKKSLNTIF
jgi:hypothetical protein